MYIFVIVCPISAGTMAKGSTWGANPTPPAASSTKCCSTKEASSAAMETLETPWFPKGNDPEMMGFHGLSWAFHVYLNDPKAGCMSFAGHGC
jgi:hypothetical protein